MGAPLPPPVPRRTAALLFNVSTLLHESIGSARHYTRMSAEVLLERQWTPISGSVELLLTDRSILATAAFTVTVAETCGACLATYALDLPVAFAEEFWPPAPQISRERRDIPEGHEGFSIVAGLLDLSEAVRQHVLLARPMRPHCGPHCPGPDRLPPPPPEGVGTETVDNRWAALQALRGRLE